jgi:ribosome production factor 1
MGRDTKGIGNAMKRGDVHRKNRRDKAQAKLKRRMEIRKAEREKGIGEELRSVSPSVSARLGGNMSDDL